MRVLGLAFGAQGSAACLVEDGRVAAAIDLERLTRTRFARATLPEYRVRLAKLAQALFELDELPEFADYYEVFPRLLHAVTGETDLGRAGIDLVVKTRDDIRPMRGQPGPYDEFCSSFGGTKALLDLEHHLCHAHQAFYASPFDDAAILTIDGGGEDLPRLGNRTISTTLGEGDGSGVSVLAEVLRPSSVGALSTNITRYLGFRDDQEANTTALAALGTDRFYRRVRDATLELFDDGTFELHEEYFQPLFEFCPRRRPGADLTQDHYDVAWACQQLTEDVMVHTTTRLRDRTGRRRLAMAGSVALNCAANARVLQDSGFEELYVVPNAGDAGLALGAALYGYHVVLGGSERHPPRDDFLGPPLPEDAIPAALRAEPGTDFRVSDDIATDAAELLARGRTIGWVQGGAEFGPRALGHRSILADPRSVESKTRLDDAKQREWFRPYGCSVLAEHADDYFEMLGPSPYKLLAVGTRPVGRERAPAVVHADGTARVQTVTPDVEPRYHRLITRFHELTGVPLVLNTSCNGAGEPMVESPHDAVRTMHALQLDALAIGDHLAWRDGHSP